MIAEIHPPSVGFYGKVVYSERKCDRGVAMLLDKNLFSDSPTGYVNELTDVANLNARVKNKCTEISINLKPGETVSDERFVKIGRKYLNEMGYFNNPYLMYKHTDKEHSHIHLILSTVNYDGKWTNDSFSREKSFKISRNIEKEYGLNPLEQNQDQNINLSTNGQNLDKYKCKHYSLSEKAMLSNSFRNGLKRACDNKAKTFFASYVTEDDDKAKISKILYSNTFNNNRCIDLLGEEKFNFIHNYLIQNGYCTIHIKGELLKILDNALHQDTKDNYFEYLENSNTEISMFSKNNKTQYAYRIKDYDYTIKENGLPKNFSYKALSEKYGEFKGTFIPEAEQKHIIYNAIRANLNESKSLQDFVSNCRKSKVSCTIGALDNDFSKPILNFKITGTKNAKTFTGEDIFKKFTFANINEQMTAKEPIIKPLTQESYVHNYQQHPNYHIPVSGGTGGGEQAPDAIDLNRKKKKRKKQDISETIDT